MKYTFASIVLLVWTSLLAIAQRYGPIECEWDSHNLTTYKVLWENDDGPLMWNAYPEAVVIRHINSGGWELPVPGGVIYPSYIIFKNEEPSVYDTCELAYNFFSAHPKVVASAIAKERHLEYRHKDFIVVVAYTNT